MSFHILDLKDLACWELYEEALTNAFRCACNFCLNRVVQCKRNSFLQNAILWQVLRVRSRLAGSDAAKQLKDGDMLLAINGTPVWSFRDIESFVDKSVTSRSLKRSYSTAFSGEPEHDDDADPLPSPSLGLTIFRDHQLMDVTVHLGQETGRGTERLVHWCGAQLQVTLPSCK
jgi:hypothetical protein